MAWAHKHLLAHWYHKKIGIITIFFKEVNVQDICVYVMTAGSSLDDQTFFSTITGMIFIG